MQGLYFFPFAQVDKGSRIAIYGGGLVGTEYVEQICNTDYCTIAFVADKNCGTRDYFARLGVEVVSPEAFRERNDFDKVLVATANIDYQSEMLNVLHASDIQDSKIIIEIKFAKHGKASYSQHGEDLIIYNAFKHMGFFKDGKLPTYIDIGAHHPFNISNTALFHQYGCHGVNIEANPELIKEFEKERPEDINLCIGIGAEEGVFPFYISEVSGLNTFKKENLEFNEFLHNYDTGEDVSYHVNEVLELSVKTIDAVISEYCGGKYPDFMSIDIEGMEYESLLASDLSNGPALIAVEVNFDGDKFIEMFKDKGYFPYLWYRENILFVRNGLEPLVHSHVNREAEQ